MALLGIVSKSFEKNHEFMINRPQIYVFGEVLFDCFPSGERVLGGAPFNVAWHLQAFGDNPVFISQVGDDALGQEIRAAMTDWNMNLTAIKTDPGHPTGNVNVKLIGSEPHYTIMPDCAYDFIAPMEIGHLPKQSILYHGTLALRNQVSRTALLELTQNQDVSIFLDVNLRSPWWTAEEVNQYIAKARWVKLNENELRELGFYATDYRQAMSDFQARFPVELVILTLGDKGAMVRSRDGKYEKIEPEPITDIVDTVGAGDAFSAVFIHGIALGWPLAKILIEAQQFAAKIIKMRGATPTTPDFYQHFSG